MSIFTFAFFVFNLSFFRSLSTLCDITYSRIGQSSDNKKNTWMQRGSRLLCPYSAWENGGKFRTLCGCNIAELHPQNDNRPQETDNTKWNTFVRFYETAPKEAYVFKTVNLKVSTLRNKTFFVFSFRYMIWIIMQIS